MTDNTPSQEASAAQPLADKPGVTEDACPWCKSEARVESLHTDSRAWAQVGCLNVDCFATGPCADTEDEAITAWNTRYRAQSEARQSPDGGREKHVAWEKALLDQFYVGPWVVCDETDEVFLSDGAWREDLWEARTHSRDTAEELARQHGGEDRPEIRAWPYARFDKPTQWRLLEENAKLRAALTPTADDVARANTDVLVEALREARCDIVTSLAFLNRDLGSERLNETAAEVVNRLVKRDETIRKALSVYGEG